MLVLLVEGAVGVVTVSMYYQIASMNEIREAASFCNKPKKREECRDRQTIRDRDCKAYFSLFWLVGDTIHKVKSDHA